MADLERWAISIVKVEYLADRQEFISTVAAWHRREWGYLRPVESLETRAAKVRAWCGHREIPTVLIASVGETLLGSAMLVAHDMDTRMQWSPWLAGVVVAIEHRRRGIGAALAERALADARHLGFPTLYLYTFSTERYWTSLGWRFIERTSYLDTEVTVMSHALQEQREPTARRGQAETCNIAPDHLSQGRGIANPRQLA
ncbi:MAG: GNAT family N-acetyltransferase [Verrucomicrobia bacterium]|nr:GNAT family N-acetyltransferase [Verrucomicrobiota bacterium]